MKKPPIKNLTASSVGIMNAIRNGASDSYKSGVPLAVETTDSIRMVGEAIMGMQTRQNEFLSALYNRIARVIIQSRNYQNPWSVFKRGLVEYGETIEEIFVNLAKPFQFDPAVAESEWMKREIPDVQAAFHTMNYQKFYKSTVSEDMLRQAFLSWDGVTDLVSRIIDQLYTSANYDEFLTMKYMLARLILDGKVATIATGAPTKTNTPAIITTIKEVSNNLTFMSSEYNMAGVRTHTPKDEQYMIMTNKFNAHADVEVLALAFNMDKVQFAGRSILVDGFDKLDNDRLAELFAGDPSYTTISDDELAILAGVNALLVDEKFFMIFDNLEKFTEDNNGQGLYWNYWYHVWRTFSASPFAQAVVFGASEGTVSSVQIAPSTASGSAGQRIIFTASIEADGIVSQDVTWGVTGATSENTTISNGILSIGTDETSDALTVTVQSKADASKSATASVSLADGGDTPSGDDTVYRVNVLPALISVAKGGEATFTATVAGAGNYDNTVTWSVTGKNSDDTKVEANGLSATVTIGSDENASAIQVVATSNSNENILDGGVVVVTA